METLENKEFVYEFGKFLLDPREKTLLADGIPVHLPAKEFDTLVLLVEHNGQALSKEEMLTTLWGGAFVEEGNLAKQISRLRKILNTKGEQFIETLPKHGYRFTADLRLIHSVAEPAVIIEKRTIKRLALSFQDDDPKPVALPPARRSVLSPLRIGLPLLILAGALGYLAWHYWPESPEPIDPYEPVRLTDNPNDDTGPVWTKDGRIRFFRVYPDNRTETWITNADGTEQTQIKFPDGRIVLSWSPDERRMMFLKPDDRRKVYLSNADGSGEVPLPSGGGGWSADSKMIVSREKVADHHFDIFVYSVETGGYRNITNSPDFDADPSFSPDGTKILFTSGRDGNSEIYIMNVDGSDMRRLTFDPSIDAHASFSPDGTQILFTSDRENENSDVYIMNADGSNPVKFTNWDKSNETAGPGGWSPDGTKIAFFSNRNGKDDIYVVTAETIRPKIVLSEPESNLHTPSFSPDGKNVIYSLESEDKTGELRILNSETGRTRLIRETELARTEPVWSPEGKRIAFIDRIDGNTEICVINPDGFGFANLTNDPSLDTNPAWSPDGTRLAFVSYRGESRVSQLYTMNADGGDPRPITPRQGWEGDPAWSPDGRKVVFVCDRNDSPGDLLDICEINVDGTGEKRVLFNRNYDSQPAVSPDGGRIAFVALPAGNPEIYLVNRDGSGLLRLTRHPADDLSPSWSPDGRSLIFTSNRSGKSAVYQVDLPW